jgi:hemerythrin-like domain-containing protein
MNYEIYRKQHKEIMDISKELSQLFDPIKLKNDAFQARHLLSIFFGKFKMHSIAEDKNLYATLLQSQNKEIKRVIRKYSEENNSISEMFNSYRGKWYREQSIRENSPTFITESKQFFSHLSFRMEKENEELYPLLEKLIIS